MGRKQAPPREPTARELADIHASSDEGRRYEGPLVHVPARPLGRRPPLLEGGDGARLLAIVESIPGFWGLWERAVPADRLLGDPPVVSCPCGAETTLTAGLTRCAGGCSRWFLRIADAVLARKFEEDDDAAAA